jgi:3-hydroxyacyl-[acyl-carrier-protein] dehydratase
MIVGVESAIPHRPPFLFVDEVLSIGDDRIEARRAVRPEEPQFKGHYPGNPIMPGVLICEALIQAGAILLSRKLGTANGTVPVLTRIYEAKFRKIVHPGDTMILRAKITERMAEAWFLSGSASVAAQTVATLQFVCTMTAV